ncbi:MAG TPA: YbhN family protein [Actinomycetota bacterium]|nr:YbhN family protein [Actinomycetota bacterium]
MTEPGTAELAPEVPAPASARWPKLALQIAVSAAIVVGIFVFAIPRIADYSDVWATISGLTWLELWSLVAITVLNLATYWFANMAALPGLTIGKSAVLTQTTTSVANTLPAGGAVAVGLTYTILRSWGFHPQSIALYVGVTGVWNIFMKLALPIFALSLLALVGDATAALVAAALVGLAVLAAAVALFALALWKKEFARRIGDGFGRVASALRRLVRRPPIRDWGEHAVGFRKRTISLVLGRWPWLTLTTVVSHLMLWVVLLLALRHVGVSQEEVSTLETLAVFAFGRLLTALPITPGGLGVIELGYIGGLVAAGGDEPQVVAAVLLFRVLTYAVPVPLGAGTYLVWRGRSSWRRPETAPAVAGPTAEG